MFILKTRVFILKNHKLKEFVLGLSEAALKFRKLRVFQLHGLLSGAYSALLPPFNIGCSYSMIDEGALKLIPLGFEFRCTRFNIV